MLSALLIVAMTALSPAPSSPSAKYATFVPVCRDARGAWDRRACRHVAHRDPHRIVLVATETTGERAIA